MKEEKDFQLSQIKSHYTLGEERANSITHGIGTGLIVAGAAGLVVLATLYGDAWRIVSFSIYGTALIILYLASTLYHSFRNPRVKQVFKIIDHSSIYLLIAGTYTPFMLVSLREGMGLDLVWNYLGFGIFGHCVQSLLYQSFYETLRLDLYFDGLALCNCH